MSKLRPRGGLVGVGPAVDLSTPQQVQHQIKRVWSGYHNAYSGQAATLIQAAWRAYWARASLRARLRGKLLRHARQDDLADSAARVLQRHVRGWLARLEASERRRAVLVIQTHWRGLYARRGWRRTLRDWRWQTAAAIEIQRHVRGHLARLRTGRATSTRFPLLWRRVAAAVAAKKAGAAVPGALRAAATDALRAAALGAAARRRSEKARRAAVAEAEAEEAARRGAAARVVQRAPPGGSKASLRCTTPASSLAVAAAGSAAAKPGLQRKSAPLHLLSKSAEGAPTVGAAPADPGGPAATAAVGAALRVLCTGGSGGDDGGGRIGAFNVIHAQVMGSARHNKLQTVRR
ncbi:hypothetical protein FOA52_000689 [Chlamydomonas sp. UWO 241]|nr:hypothetical protein FOA52_000689 [Chlamydomonas sp. UWO 241]